MVVLSMSSLVFARFSRSWVAGDCNEGCQNSATSLRAEFCQGDPLGAPSPSATPATRTVRTLPKLGITYGDLLRNHYSVSRVDVPSLGISYFCSFL
jgi:hypothetical protein